MAASLPRVDFARIREHESSRQRAFEELGFILVPTIDNLPTTTRLVRRGTPDAGIEFSCPSPDGKGIWAWQAKYLFSIDDSAIQQMQASVYEAMEHEPTLSRYVFILPVERPAARVVNAAGREIQSAMQKWENAVQRWHTKASELGMSVTFDYIGHSELVRAVTRNQHAGHLRYFFDQTVFSDEFCAEQVAVEVRNLGDRYLPQVHVEVELSSRFEALARTPRFRDAVRGALVTIKRHAWLDAKGLDTDPALTEQVDLVDRAVDTLIANEAAAGTKLIEADDVPFVELRALADTARTAMDRAHNALWAVRRATSAVSDLGDPKDDSAKAGKALCAAIDEVSARIGRLRTSVDDLVGLVDQTMSGPVLLVAGSAGCGKSHLVADLALGRTATELPTLLLRGQQFAAVREVWPQISEAIGVDLISADLLATLSAAAQTRRRGKALLIIDGLNEGAGVRYWRDRLPGVLAVIERYPWVAVVLTVRDTYQSGLTSNAAIPLTTVRHPGLAGHEAEALAIYAEHNGLRVPDIPPLNPELRNPLFLGSLCRSVRGRGMTEIPRDAVSLTWVFDGLITWVNSQLAERLDFDPRRQIVTRTIAAIAERMLALGTEALPLSEAERICDELMPSSSGGYSQSLLHGLTVESLLLQEPSPRHQDGAAEDSQQVRFTYQRLSDHLRSEVILRRCTDLEHLRIEVTALATAPDIWSRLGLLEALSLVIPERHGIELIDLLQEVVSTQANSWLRRELAEHLIATLAWRSPASIRTETIKMATHASMMDEELASSWLDVQLSLACVPDHPLNSDRLHRQLKPQSLADRDLGWSYSVVMLWNEDHNAITRLIDWAWSGRVEDLSPETRRLAGQTLAWLLASPNRTLRDSATKALLRITDNHTDTLADLAIQFAEVNDAYVTERISAICYGHLLRHRHLDHADITSVARVGQACTTLRHQSMTSGHILQRWASAQALDLANVLLSQAGHETTQAPQPPAPAGPDWRINAPSLEELAATYRREPSRYLFSLSTFGYDFEKYVIRHACEDLIYQGQDELITERNSIRARRRKARPRRVASAQAVNAAKARTTLETLLDQEDEPDVPSPAEIQNAVDTLQKEIEARLADLRSAKDSEEEARPKIPEPERPDPNEAGRWISQRVHDLGWTDDRFAGVDRVLTSFHDRDHRKSERFGKKYAWIAFHELLGVLTDHCQLMRSYADIAEEYAGPWQFTGLRDVDPSDATRGDSNRPASRRTQTTQPPWWERPYHLDLAEGGEHAAWLHDDNDIPGHLGLLSVADPLGEEWLALECHMTWSLRFGTSASSHLIRQQWIRSQSYIIDEGQLQKIKRWAPRQNWMGIWLPTPGEFPPGLLGEFSDLGPWPSYLAESAHHAEGTDHDAPADPDPDWSKIHTHRLRTRMALTTARIGKESSNDMSATALMNRLIPSRIILKLLDARWAPTLSVDPVYELGPDENALKWHDDTGLVAFTAVNREFDSLSALWVKASPLRAALASQGLALWAWSLGEKIPWHDEHTPARERTDIYAAHQYAPAPAATWRTTIQRT